MVPSLLLQNILRGLSKGHALSFNQFFEQPISFFLIFVESDDALVHVLNGL